LPGSHSGARGGSRELPVPEGDGFGFFDDGEVVAVPRCLDERWRDVQSLEMHGIPYPQDTNVVGVYDPDRRQRRNETRPIGFDDRGEAHSASRARRDSVDQRRGGVESVDDVRVYKSADPIPIAFS